MIADRTVQQCLAEANQQPTIRAGSRGPAVVRWQRLLAAETRQAFPRPGVFDAVTVAATKGYQQRLRLVADGVVGPKTWTAAAVRACSRGRASAQAGLGDVLLFSAVDWKSAALGAVLGAAGVLFLRS